MSDVSSPFEPMEKALAESSGWGSGGRVPSDEFVIEGDVGFGRGFGPDLGTGPDGRPIVGFDDFGNPVFVDEVEQTGFPFWAGSLIGLYVLSVAALFLAVRRLRTPAEAER